MNLPLIGPLTISGFEHKWYFLFLLVILGLVALYAVAQIARRRRVLRFANTELLRRREEVLRPPGQPGRRRLMSKLAIAPTASAKAPSRSQPVLASPRTVS
jgi:Ca-activated chloride channel homolog